MAAPLDDPVLGVTVIHDMRNGIAELLRGEPAGPEVGRLDDVIVDAEQLHAAS
jgi:hypothetical protein